MEQTVLFPSEPPMGKAETLRLDELPEDPWTKAPGWLVDSIKRYGVLVPVIVLDHGDDGYEVLDGNRRVAAARRLKLEDVAARVFDSDDFPTPEALAIALNEQRSSNPVTEVENVHELVVRQGRDAHDVAKATGLTTPYVVSIASLAGANKSLMAGMREGKIKFSVVRKAAKLSKASQSKLAQRLEAGEQITAKDVDALLRLEIRLAETLPIMGDDPIITWTGNAIRALTEISGLAPDGAPPTAVVYIDQALSVLKGGRA